MNSSKKAGCALFLAVLLATTSYAADKKQKPQLATADEVRELRQLLEAQRDELRELREEMRLIRAERAQAADALRVATEAQEKAAGAQTAATQQQESVSRLQSDVADLKTNLANAAVSTQDDQKRVGGIEGILSRFRFTGDIRLRYENFYQEGAPTRHRPRVRLRFGFEGKLGEDFYGGMFLASGALGTGAPSFADPISTNETLTGFFERKAVGFDRGWVTYQPQAHKWLQLTGGKWAFTWLRTPLTFDSDLNPEGFSEKLSFDVKNSTVRNLSFVGMQILFNEAGGGADSFALGGQVSSSLQLGKRVTITPAYTLLNWRNADPIAAAALDRTINANSNTNATTPDGRAFLSKFLYSDLLVDTSVKTPWARWPVRLLLEYEKNLNALSSQDAAFWGEMTFGQTRDKDDLAFTYGLARIEQDAVISQFNESDFRAATNVLQHRFQAQWQVRKNVTASYEILIGRTLDTSLQNALRAPGVAPGEREPYLKRMRFDLIYKF